LQAGNGTRFKKKQKKQYAIYKNLKIFEHSVFKAIKSKLFKKIVLVIDNPKNVKNLYSKDLIILKGGKKRSSSLLLLLNILKNLNQKMY
jgi:2-C-methyl-D-erythritol 4-phosphate cytidylyltransferase/2-C-methyl-D-erythritol 2,4-cyclodiphosphate synthase